MAERSSASGRLILGIMLVSVVVCTSLIVAAAFGFTNPKPTLDIMAIVLGSIVCGVAAWRYVRLLRPRQSSSD